MWVRILRIYPLRGYFLVLYKERFNQNDINFNVWRSVLQTIRCIQWTNSSPPRSTCWWVTTEERRFLNRIVNKIVLVSGSIVKGLVSLNLKVDESCVISNLLKSHLCFHWNDFFTILRNKKDFCKTTKDFHQLRIITNAAPKRC